MAAGVAGGGVQDPVAQRFGLGAGQLTGKGKVLQPGEQVDGDGGGQTPGLVDGELAGR